MQMQGPSLIWWIKTSFKQMSPRYEGVYFILYSITTNIQIPWALYEPIITFRLFDFEEA